MKKMTKWNRVAAALNGDEVDRIPISLWKHYHLRDRAPAQQAEVTLQLHQQFDIDLIKLTPSGLYGVQDWGVAIRFGTTDDEAPIVVEPAVATENDWATLRRLDVNQGALRRELEMIRIVEDGLKGSTPTMMTVFSPLTLAQKLVGGDRIVDDLRQAPKQVHAGLVTIRDTVIDYAAACLEAGASGFFFATQMATYNRLTQEEYQEFGAAYDRPILESIAGKSRITMLHACGENLMFDLVADYPVDVINWADSTSGTSLKDARKITDKPLAGGLALETLLSGSENDVARDVHNAVEQAGQLGFMLAPACVIRGPSPDANLAAVRQAAEKIASA